MVYVKQNTKLDELYIFEENDDFTISRTKILDPEYKKRFASLDWKFVIEDKTSTDANITSEQIEALFNLYKSGYRL